MAVFAAQLGAQNTAPAPTSAPAAREGGSKSVDNPKCGMIYGESHAFMVCAPDGWILDNSIGNQDGIFAVFYPDGSSWYSAKESGTVMYVNTYGKPDDQYTVAKAIEFDAEDTIKSEKSPVVVVKKGEPIKLDDLFVPVQLFAPGGFNRYEAVAYIDSPKIIITIAMTSKNEDAFKRDYPLFVQLVQSYKFLTTDVVIQHK